MFLPPEGLIRIGLGLVDMVPSTFQSSGICESCLVLWLVASMQILMAIFPASKNCPLLLHCLVTMVSSMAKLPASRKKAQIPGSTPFPAENDPGELVDEVET